MRLYNRDIISCCGAALKRGQARSDERIREIHTAFCYEVRALQRGRTIKSRVHSWYYVREEEAKAHLVRADDLGGVIMQQGVLIAYKGAGGELTDAEGGVPQEALALYNSVCQEGIYVEHHGIIPPH